MSLIKKLFNKEIISYGIWGVLTTIWNIGIFQFFFFIGIDYRAANAIALITTKIIAYIVNKLFVFKSHCKTKRELWAEIFRFIVTRGITMVIDFFGLILLNYIIDPKFGKILTTIVVVTINYIFGKHHVYKVGKEPEGVK
ncbi:GtrA family protein [Treponema primitia]|uniref:GtrA family protein n=1 Tax=Treponema primitia TaxID=88058 RepID=UPI003980BECD